MKVIEGSETEGIRISNFEGTLKAFMALLNSEICLWQPEDKVKVKMTLIIQRAKGGDGGVVP